MYPRSIPASTSPESPEVRTRYLDVAAYLLTKGFQLARVDLIGATAVFCFSDLELIGEAAVKEFHNGGQVPAAAFAAAQKRVRDLMWEARRTS